MTISHKYPLIARNAVVCNQPTQSFSMGRAWIDVERVFKE